MPKRDRDVAPDGEGIGLVLDALGKQRPWVAGLALGELGRQWGSVVGERLAQECTPVALQGGVLLIRAATGGWAAQLRFLTGEIRNRANQVLGEGSIRDVKVVLDREPAGGQDGRR
jgi:predicted nucleic acid-binding Zn ribbon protein